MYQIGPLGNGYDDIRRVEQTEPPTLPNRLPHQISPTSDTVMLVNLWAVRKNVQEIKNLSPATRQLDLYAVIKENGYGCGAATGIAALNAGASGVCVFDFAEAKEIGNLAPYAKIIALARVSHSHAAILEGLPTCVQPVIRSPSDLRLLRQIARRRERPFDVHVDINLGIGRGGLAPGSLNELLAAALQCEWVHVAGLMGHFSCAGFDDAITERECEAFDAAVVNAQELLPRAAVVSLPNTTGTLLGQFGKLANACRIGWGLHGAELVGGNSRFQPRPSAKVAARITAEVFLRQGESHGYRRWYVASRDTRLGVLRMKACPTLALPDTGLVTPVLEDPFDTCDGDEVSVLADPMLSEVFVDLTNTTHTVGSWVTLCDWDADSPRSIARIAKAHNYSGTRTQIAMSQAVDEVVVVDVATPHNPFPRVHLTSTPNERIAP